MLYNSFAGFLTGRVGVTPATLVASGVVATGVDIPVAASGAAIGDLIVVLSSYGSTPTPGGASWSVLFDATISGGTVSVQYKILTATTDITTTGGNYFSWAVYRGPTSAALLTSTSVSGTTSDPVAIAAFHPAHCGLVFYMTGGDNSTPTPPTGFTARAAASNWDAGNSRHQDLQDNLMTPLDEATYTVGCSSGAFHATFAVELRR